jgi:hypothetical protein
MVHGLGGDGIEYFMDFKVCHGRAERARLKPIYISSEPVKKKGTGIHRIARDLSVGVGNMMWVIGAGARHALS